MKYVLNKSFKKPFLFSRNNIITEVNNEFCNLTGYSNDELLGKSLKELENMIKVQSQINIEIIKDECKCFIFTKECEPREVTILCENLKYKNEKMYTFKENHNSRIEDRLLYSANLITHNKDGFAIYSASNGVILDFNDKYLGFWHHVTNKVENIVGMSFEEIFTVNNENYYKSLFIDVIKTGNPHYTNECKIISFQNKVTYWDISLFPISVSGKVKYVLHSASDITERVLSRKLLEDQKEELEAIIENMSDEVLILNKNGNCEIMNKALRNNPLFKGVGFINQDYVSKNISHFDANGNPISLENKPIPRVLRGETFSEYRVDYKNNLSNQVTMHREVNGAPIFDNDGNLLRCVLVYRDISDRLKNEELKLIKTQYDLLNSMIENLNLSCVRITYPDFNINYVNNMSEYLLKYTNHIDSASDLIGKNFFELINFSTVEKEEIKSKLEDLISNKNNSCSFYRRRIIDGQERFFKVIYQPVFDLNQEVKELIITDSEITDEILDKNKMEEALRIQEEAFINMAHELKTPLNVIFSTNQLMQLCLKDDLTNSSKERLSRSINVIKQNCYRFIKLINNIMDISRINAGFLKLNLSNKNIVQITEDIVQSVSEYVESKGLNIVFDTNTEEKIIACDSEKIERIILNLISNSIKFSNNDGCIFVDINDKGETVEISVRDNGIGMDKEVLDYIFKRFHKLDKSLSRNAEGTGVGLSLVKSIVELHGGKINVESEVGQGSLFKIELPVRIIEESLDTNDNKIMQSKIERINIEFSDIYSI